MNTKIVLLFLPWTANLPFDEEPTDLNVLSTLTIAACLMCAGELSRGFLVGGCSLGAVSLSSEEWEARAGHAPSHKKFRGKQEKNKNKKSQGILL